eukprot:14555017-Ditylum_brightwellii.AAC.1
MIYNTVHIQLAPSARCRIQLKTGENMPMLQQGDKNNSALPPMQKELGTVGNDIRSAHTSVTEK